MFLFYYYQYYCVWCDFTVFWFEMTHICLLDYAVIFMGSILVFIARLSCLLESPSFPLHCPGDLKSLTQLNLWSDGLFGIKCKNQYSSYGLLGIKSNLFTATFPLVKSIYRHFKGIRKPLKNFKQELKANKPQVLRVTTKKRPFLFLPTHASWWAICIFA